MALRARTRRRQEVGKELFGRVANPSWVGKIGILERSRGTERHTRIGIVRQLQRRPPAVVPEHPFAQSGRGKTLLQRCSQQNPEIPGRSAITSPPSKIAGFFLSRFPTLRTNASSANGTEEMTPIPSGIRAEVAFPFRFFDILINRVHTR